MKTHLFPKSEVPVVNMYVWEVNAREVRKGSGIVWEVIQKWVRVGGVSGMPIAQGEHLKKSLRPTGIERNI